MNLRDTTRNQSKSRASSPVFFSTKASNTMIEDPRLAVDTMERGSQQFVPEKRPNHVLKPVPSQQYQQDCYQHEPPHQQQHYQRHHHHHGQPHGPQYTLQVR